jgi:hypothetical protein
MLCRFCKPIVAYYDPSSILASIEAFMKASRASSHNPHLLSAAMHFTFASW